MNAGTRAWRLVSAGVLSLTCAAAASAQSIVVPAPFAGGVATGEVSAQPVSLSLSDAIARGLQNNLGVLAREQGVKDAKGERWRALADLLPTVDGHVSEARQVVNLEAFGFKGLGGLPSLIGPFNAFDARVSLSQPVLDLSALNGLRAEDRRVKAEQYELQDARELVVLVVTNLYLEAVTSASRLDAARAQLQTADALFHQATDLKTSGMVAGIDVVRAEVEQSSERQRVIAAENDVEKRKLQLARAIGLPLAQVFTLPDRIQEAPANLPIVEDALARARTTRPDYLAAQQRVEAADASRRAAVAEWYPSVHVDANYGATGFTLGSSLATYAFSGFVKVPIFDGNRRGKVIQADAELQRRKNELADFASRVEYDVRTAVLDVRAATDQLSVARSTVELANRELTQARDRFGAGVADNIEVVRAQESLAEANERFFESLYRLGLAKVTLGRAMALTVDDMKTMFGRTQ